MDHASRLWVLSWRKVKQIMDLAALKERLSGPPARRAAFYSLAQTAYSCLAGSFEMPMALRLAGKLEYVALVYAFYYTLLLAGFSLGLLLVREGRASFVFRLELGLLAGLAFGSAIFFPNLSGLTALGCYFAIRGLAEGLYWSARHRTHLWAVRDSGRDDFALKLQSFVVVFSILLPLISGAVVSFLGPRLIKENPLLPSGYVSVFLLTGTVLAVAFLISPTLKIGRSPVTLAKAASVRHLSQASTWRSFLFLLGLSGVAAAVGSGIITFGVLKTEFRIGLLNALVALLSGSFFFLLRKAIGGKSGARKGAILAGASADCLSRVVYAIAPITGGLAFKSLLDAFAVPLKSLFGENVQRAHLERLAALSGTSVAELYLYQETRLWLARLTGCAIVGIGTSLALSFAGPEGARSAVRVIIALAAPLAFIEYRFLRSFIVSAKAEPS